LLRLLAFAPDGATLATADQSRYQWDGDYEVKLWHLNPPAVRRVWRVPRGAGLLRFTADGNSVLVQNRQPLGDEWEVTVFDAAVDPGKNGAASPPQPIVTPASAVSPDNRLLVRFIQPAPPPPEFVDLPGLQTRTPLRPLPEGQRLSAGEFSPDAKLFALWGQKIAKPPSNWLETWLERTVKKSRNETNLHLYDTATGCHRGTVPGVIGPRIRFSSDSRLLVVLGQGQTPTVWELPLRRRWLQLCLSWGGLVTLLIASWWLYRRRRALLANRQP
jgi:hypothetical protein